MSGDTRIRDINRALDWNIPDDDVSTVGGLIVRRRGGLPEVGEVVRIDHIDFRILERHGWRIDGVEIRRSRIER